MDSEIKARKAKIINFEGYKSCRKISVFHTPRVLGCTYNNIGLNARFKS